MTSKNQVIPFEFNQEYRLTAILNKDNSPWFVAKDVCNILGYAHSPSAVRNHCKQHKIMTVPKQHSQRGGARHWTIIPEADLYRQIIKSRLPAAEAFEAWVMEEVLPSIRKDGGYIHTSQDDSDEEIMAKAILLAQKTIDRQKEKIAELEPKADGYDQFLDQDRRGRPLWLGMPGAGGETTPRRSTIIMQGL